MVVIGARGFAKQLIEVFFQQKHTKALLFFDEVNTSKTFLAFPVLTSEEEVKNVFINVSDKFSLGTGNALLRKKMYERFSSLGGTVTSVISPAAYLSKFARVAEGTCVLTGAIVETDAEVGLGALVNCWAMIHHDVKVGAFSEIAPGAILLGNSVVGSTCIIGAGAIIMPGVRVDDFSVVGANSLVTKDVAAGITVIGSPAKPINKL